MAKSLWLDHDPVTRFGPLEGAARFDVVVVGGGLTGLATAVLFSRAGRRVAVVEGRRIGAAATGNTTAKISLLQGTRISTLAKGNPQAVVDAYVEANREGQQWLLAYCRDRNVPFEFRAAITYATTAAGVKAARGEQDQALRAGLDVEWRADLDLPYPTRGGVVLGGQAQFDPMDVLAAMADDVTSRGGTIFEQTRVLDVDAGSDGCTVVTEHGDVAAAHVVLATGMPILDRGGFFARLEPQRSYAAAFDVPGPVPDGMFLSADPVTRSLRTAPADDRELLLVGGNGHIVGRHASPAALVQDLTAWTERHFPGARRTHWWSAQDYESVDGPPYVGPLLPGREQILVATGYDKWGMTNAVAAALALSGAVLDKEPPAWAHAFRSWRRNETAGVGCAAKLNGAVALHLAQGWLKVGLSGDGQHAPAEGQGRVERRGPRPVAVCTVNGQTHEVSAVCPHLQGLVTWNDAELSWDCPLHGSRFAATGEVLEGPAVTGLASLAAEPPAAASSG